MDERAERAELRTELPPGFGGTLVPAWLLYRDGEKIYNSDGSVSVAEVREDRSVWINPTKERWK